MKEIEILVEVNSTKDEALHALQQFEFQGIKKTLDVYFYDPLRKELQADAIGGLAASFRLRTKDGMHSVAYKVDHFNDSEWSHSDEYETTVANSDAMNQIIEKLGLVELVRVDNEKHTFRTPDYEIVLEEVKDLGLFMEVEKVGQVPDDKIAETKEAIRAFMQSLNIILGKEQNAGKPELLLRKRLAQH